MVKVDDGFRAPNDLTQFLAGYDLTGALDQSGQYFERLALQVEFGHRVYAIRRRAGTASGSSTTCITVIGASTKSSKGKTVSTACRTRPGPDAVQPDQPAGQRRRRKIRAD